MVAAALVRTAGALLKSPAARKLTKTAGRKLVKKALPAAKILAAKKMRSVMAHKAMTKAKGARTASHGKTGARLSLKAKLMRRKSV